MGIHRHIPCLFAYFEENGQFFLVQEYIEGEDLAREIIAGVYRQDEGKVVALLTEILSILEFVHHTDPDIQFSYPEDWNQALAQLEGTVHCSYPRQN